MTSAVRLRVFAVAGAGLLALLLWSFAGLPDFGDYQGPYGDVLNRVVIPERHATAVVSAVNFDYRAFDTLGEEFILFAAVLGVASLLRRLRDERDRPPDHDAAAGRRVRETSVTVSAVGLLLVGPTILVGLYVVAHGHQTPGGGFQGGVILASALLLTYLSDRYTTLRRVGPVPILELGEGAGALGLVLLGLLGLVAGEAFFENVLPLGETGTLLSAGTIEPGNVAVAFAVAGGFSFMLVEFLEQTLVRRRRRRRPRDVRRGQR